MDKGITEIERYEVLFAGSGGQGIILGGLVIADSAMRQSLNAVHTASYGPESRGGASQSDVIISSKVIDYPAVESPNFLIALTQESANKFVPETAPNGTVLLDSTWVEEIPSTFAKEIYHIALSKESAVRFGKSVYANIVAVGFFTGKTGFLKPQTVRQVIEERVPKRFLKENISAFEFGMELAKVSKRMEIGTFA